MFLASIINGLQVKNSRNEKPDSAFTRMDLLAVTVIVVLLGLVLSPALARTRVIDQSFECQNHLRQLMGAMLMYTHDYSDLFPPNPGTGPTTPGWDWCPGDAYDAASLKDPSRSLLVPYIAAKVELFHCPADHGVSGTSTGPGLRLQCVRDYCMNEAVGTDPSTGGKLAVNGGWLTVTNHGLPGNTRNGPWLTYGKTTSVARPAPAALLVLLDVSPKSNNDAGFAVTMIPELFRDCPGIFHNLGCSIAFADGRSEIKMWEDSRIALWPNGEPYNPPNPDVIWLQERTSALK